MASLGISECCTIAFKHDGESLGKISAVAGVESYVSGEEYGYEKVIVILTDIYGHSLKNVQLIADQLSAMTKIQVIIPDIINKDVYNSSEPLPDWLSRHGLEITGPIVDNFLRKLKEEKSSKKVYGIGYCFGAKYAIRALSSDGLLDAAAVAHPSLVTVEEVEKITKPIIISSGTTDVLFTEELREKTTKILTAKSDVYYQLDLFQNAPHGYAVKGDLSIPSVKYAKEKTLLDQVLFFRNVEGLINN